MEIITTLGVVGFILRLSHKITGLLFLWWRKEYRWDRMLVHLRTKQGETVLLGKTHLILIALALLWMPVGMRSVVDVFVGFTAIALGLLYIRSIRSWFVPPLSPKVVMLFVALCAVIPLMVLWSPFPILIALLIADLLLFPVSALVVIGMSMPTKAYHWFQITKAVKRLRAHEPMTVIGITGSYGKTSVKDYVSTILGTSYKTLKTAASKNSPIGIAEVILQSLRSSHTYFVVEMGAYKRGEIREMSHMVRPEIGVLTAINPQHQDLFGSIETTMKAKYELLQSLVGKKIAIVNLDDAKTRQMGAWAKKDGCEVWGWSTQSKLPESVVPVTHTFRAANIEVTDRNVSFDCTIGREKAHIEAAVIGAHQVGNILAAVAAAVAGGMEFNDAAAAVKKLQAAPKVMEVVPGIHGSVFIDDTFNNNPDAAKAAIQFLGRNKGKKILVFQPMIELGTFAEASHEAVGAEAARNTDVIFLTNANFFSSFARGVKSVASDVSLSVAKPSEIADYITKHVKKDDMVLFKGKDAEHALTLLKV